MTNEGKIFLNTEVNQLHGLVYHFDRVGEKILKDELEISYADFLLMMLVDNIGASTQQQLSQYLMLTKSTISKRVDLLYKKNYLVREVNSDNRRENVVRLSNDGNETIILAYRLLAEAADPYFSILKLRRDAFKEMLSSLYTEIHHDHNH